MRYNSRFCALLLLGLTPTVLSAQDAADAAQLRAVAVQAVRDGAPPVPYVLVFRKAEEADVIARVGTLLRLPVKQIATDRSVSFAGGDTVAISIQIERMTATSATAMIDSWGKVMCPSKLGPTEWFVRQKADIVRKNGAWTIMKLTTLLES